MTRPSYTPSYQLANVTATATATANSTTSATPSPQSSSSINVGAIAGGVVGGVVFLIILAVIAGWCLRRRKVARELAAADHGRASELPSYDDSKVGPAVEISPNGRDMGFTPYQPYPQNPVELQAGENAHDHSDHAEEEHDDLYGEGHDQLRPLSTPPLPTPPVSPPLSPPPMGYGRSGHSPQMSTGSMNSQTEDVPAPAKPIIQRKSVASNISAGGRDSRQSEVSGLS